MAKTTGQWHAPMGCCCARSRRNGTLAPFNSTVEVAANKAKGPLSLPAAAAADASTAVFVGHKPVTNSTVDELKRNLTNTADKLSGNMHGQRRSA